MTSKRIFFIQLFVVFIIDGILGFVGLCSDNDTTNGKSLFLITFDFGSDEYYNKTSLEFNFNASHQQRFVGKIEDGSFGFVNRVPSYHPVWHGGALDHTENDTNGYMYLANVGEYGSQLFSSTVSNLCDGVRYEFSAYLANIFRIENASIKPNVRFEVRAAATPNNVFAQFNTSDISEYDNMTWSKFGLSFSASSSSVVLLMISNVVGGGGNDLAIDDIELRVCSTGHSGFCLLETSISTISSLEYATSSSSVTHKQEELLPFFTPQQCNGSTKIGANCNTSGNPCDMLNPCQNSGTCNNTNTTHRGYNCSCPAGFNGTDCEFDHRPCKPHTCLYHGKCNETSSTEFHCVCDEGWQGVHCESMINLCEDGKCLNRGVCRPLLLNYSCECLNNSYSGRHCEITAKRIIIYKIVSKSFAYIAIIAMVSVAVFVVIMDILKYCFGIDPVCEERETFRREKRAKRRKRPVIQRFVYVNAPPVQSRSDQPITTIEETTT